MNRTRPQRAAFLSGAFVLALVGLCPAKADEAAVPTRDTLVAELRGLGHRLADERARLGGGSPPGTVAEALSEAQVAFLDEDYARSMLLLAALVARPGIEQDPGYGEVLAWLGDSLWHLGLYPSALARLREALAHQRLPSEYRRTFALYLDRAAFTEPLDTVREFWRRYQSMRPEGPLADEDRDLRYGYAKALYHGGALAEAEALFGAMDTDDPHHLQARYFLGVIALSRGQRKAAREAFKGALEDWESARPKRPSDEPPEYLDDVEPRSGGPSLEVREIEAPAVPDRLPDEAGVRFGRMGEVIHLALARLAAASDDPKTAWSHYRRVPPGSPDFADALTESTIVLAQRGEFAWCARLVDQLLAGRGDDASAAQLGLWKAQLLAQAAQYDEARAAYVALQQVLDRRAAELQSALDRGDDRIFGEALLAWTTPELARQARDLEAAMVGESEAIEESREIVGAVQAALADAATLPSIRRAQAVHDQVERQLQSFQGRLERAEALARGGSAETYGKGPAATLEDTAQLRESATRLAARLDRFQATLGDQEHALRQRAAAVIAEEAPQLDAYRAALDGEEGHARLLATAMRSTAAQNLDGYAAAAFFGQVDLAWWRKEEMSRHLASLLEERRQLLQNADDSLHDARLDDPTALPPKEPATAPAAPTSTPAPASMPAAPDDAAPDDAAPSDDGVDGTPVSAAPSEK